MTITRRDLLRLSAAGALGVGGAYALAASPATAQVPAANSNQIELPRRVHRGIARAVIFDSQVPDSSVYDGRVTFVWSATGQAQPRGVLPSRYYTISWYTEASRDTDDPTLDLAWFQEHHPDWIIYRSDRVTPACNPPYVSLNITNPAVRQFYLDHYIDPSVNAGWKVIAFDLVNPHNYYGGTGRYDLDGNWVHLYGPDTPPTEPPPNGFGPALDDPAWQADQLEWLTFLRDYLHQRQVSVAANINLPLPSNAVQRAATRRLADMVDIYVDEKGFVTSWASNRTDEDWRLKFDLMRDFAGAKAIVSINRTSAPHLADADPVQVNYAIGNYLLFREPRDMLALVGTTEYGDFPDRPELNFDIGAPVGSPQQNGGAWQRTYSRGITVVNPSSTTDATVPLPPGPFVDCYGNRYHGSVLVPSASAVILRLGE